MPHRPRVLGLLALTNELLYRLSYSGMYREGGNSIDSFGCRQASRYRMWAVHW